MRFLPANAQHIGDRHSQQDSFGFADPDDREFVSHAGFLAVVCDGMGGMEHGDAASRMAVRAFLDAYLHKTPDESIPAALERSVREANDQVVMLATALGLVENIGTTLIAAATVPGGFYYISVGDSGLFLVKQGHVLMVNRQHVFANLLEQAVERGTISQEEALRHPERESLTSYIGAEMLEEIDHNLEPLPLEQGDTLLLASDGMFKTLAPEEMQAFLEGPPQTWPDVLVAQTLAKRREHQDNVTVLSVTLAPDAPAPLAPPPPAVETRAASSPPAWTPPVQAPSTPPARSARGKRVVILAVLMAGAAGAWWYLQHRPAALPSGPVLNGPVRPPGQSPPPIEIEPNVREPAPPPGSNK